MLLPTHPPPGRGSALGLAPPEPACPEQPPQILAFSLNAAFCLQTRTSPEAPGQEGKNRSLCITLRPLHAVSQQRHVAPSLGMRGGWEQPLSRATGSRGQLRHRMLQLQAPRTVLHGHPQWEGKREAGYCDLTVLVCLFIFNFFSLLATPCGMWDLSSPTRDRSRTPCIEKRSLNHWTSREVLTVFV